MPVHGGARKAFWYLFRNKTSSFEDLNPGLSGSQERIFQHSWRKTTHLDARCDYFSVVSRCCKIHTLILSSFRIQRSIFTTQSMKLLTTCDLLETQHCVDSSLWYRQGNGVSTVKTFQFYVTFILCKHG